MACYYSNPTISKLWKVYKYKFTKMKLKKTINNRSKFRIRRQQQIIINSTIYKIILVIVLSNLTIVSSQPVTIRLRQGDIQGVVVETDNRQVNAFLGIPYAKPPVDQRRFKPPEPHEGWNEPLQAIEFGPACPQPFQPGLAISEDCLFLNVWTPTNGRFRQIPVVVVFDGELFLTSDPSRFPGQDLAVYEVIVVTVNYRVNAFGFLSWQDNVLPGNLGLLDQTLALRWVAENIEVFGGDVRSVTLLGHSAGAASVGFHLASEHSRVLFQKAIMFSGSSLAPWAVSRRPRYAASTLARELGCNFNVSARDSSSYLLRCLQRRDVTLTEIVSKVEKMVEAGNPYYLFGPVYDGHVSRELRIVGANGPIRLLEDIPTDIPVLIGASEDDGSVILYLKREINYMSYAYLRQYGKEVLVPMVIAMAGHDGASMPFLNHLVDYTYLQRALGGDKSDLVRSTVQMFTDTFFMAPINAMVEVLARGGVDLHFFINDFVTQDIYNSPSNITGSLHGSEMVFLFGPTSYTRIFRRPMTYDEAKMSEKLKKMVYSFAVRGEPTLGNSYPPPPRWDQYTMRDPVHALLNTGQLSSGYRYHDLAFWNILLPDLAQMVPDKTVPERVKPKPIHPTKRPDLPETTRHFSDDSTPSEVIGPDNDSPTYRSAVWVLVAIVLLLVFVIGTYMICSRRRQRLKSANLHVP